MHKVLSVLNDHTSLSNIFTVLVMLLRLRQICAHPALITEGGAAYVVGDQEDANGHNAELTRAQRLMGLDFVLRMREKFKQVALERMAAEKAVSRLLYPCKISAHEPFSPRMPHWRAKTMSALSASIVIQKPPSPHAAISSAVNA